VTRPALPLAALLLLAAASPSAAAPAPAPAPKGRTGLVRPSYEPPKNPAHQALYAHFREKKLLETFAEVLGAIRLPRELWLRFAGCDGESNAWFDADEHRITFCYEFLAELDQAAVGGAEYGISREDALDGAVVFVLLHESGHAIFNYLQVPILGREEDAADHFAGYFLLRAGKAVARRALAGAAWMYKHDSGARKIDESDFADVHGLDAQRLYNVLCMAYGSDPDGYRSLVDKGHLPRDRAEGCADEYAQVGYAVNQLISASLDPNAVAKTRARHKAKWEGPPASAPPVPAPSPAPAAAPAPAAGKR
jgi:hypothetical protein